MGTATVHVAYIIKLLTPVHRSSAGPNQGQHIDVHTGANEILFGMSTLCKVCTNPLRMNLLSCYKFARQKGNTTSYLGGCQANTGWHPRLDFNFWSMDYITLKCAHMIPPQLPTVAVANAEEGVDRCWLHLSSAAVQP